MANIKLSQLTELTTVSSTDTIFYVADLSTNPDVSHYLKLGTISSLTDYSIANAAFKQANTAFSTGYNANTALIRANAGFNKANVAHLQANTATVLAQASYNQANSSTVLGQSSFNRANAAFAHASSSYNLANTTSISTTSAFNRANAAFAHASSSYNLANTINTTSLPSLTNFSQAAFNRANNSVLKTGDAITGIVTVPTAATGTSNTMIASTAFVKNSINAIPQTGIGIGQTWQDVKTIRASGVNYVNTTGKPIMVATSIRSTNGWIYMRAYVDGVQICETQPASPTATSGGSAFSFIVPAGSTYRVNFDGPAVIQIWAELR